MADATSEHWKKLKASGSVSASSVSDARRGRVVVVVALGAGHLIVVVGVVEHDRLLAEHEQVPAVGPGEDVAIEDERRRTLGDHGLVHRHDVLEPLGGADEVVRSSRRRSCRAPASASRMSRRSSWVVMSTPVTGSSRRYSCGAAARARARKTRRRWPPDSDADLGAGVVAHADLVECLGDRVTIVRARPAQRPEGRVATHHHHVPGAHREAPVDGLGLGNVGDPSRLDARRCSQHIDRTGPRLQEPGDDLEQGALAAAVGAEDRRQRARPELDVGVADRDPCSVARAHAGQPNGGLSGARSLGFLLGAWSSAWSWAVVTARSTADGSAGRPSLSEEPSRAGRHPS